MAVGLERVDTSSFRMPFCDRVNSGVLTEDSDCSQETDISNVLRPAVCHYERCEFWEKRMAAHEKRSDTLLALARMRYLLQL